MYHVGSCPKCHQGLLGFRVCGGKERHLVILCDECDAVWKSPDTSRRASYPGQPELPCPDCGASLRKKPSRWASLRDIHKAGWDEQIVAQYTRRKS
jgi:hypothetical protein